MVDLSDIKEETYRKQVLSILERQENMWSGALAEMKGVAESIALKPGTRPNRQQAYRTVHRAAS